MTQTEEKALIARAQSGELGAFEEIVTAYEKRVFALAFRSSGNEEDARDIAQEVFLRVYRSLAQFRGESGLSTWIYRITMNICVDFARKGTASVGTASLSGEDEQEIALPDTDRTHMPEAVLENEELREELQTALSQLTEEHRNIVLLRDVSGLTYDEIARTLDLSEGTVKSRLARARKNLRDILLKRGNIFVHPTSKETERRTV